jgi:hypothetical protein
METILLHSIITEKLFSKIRGIVKEEIKSPLQQDQLLTKEGILKMIGISNARFLSDKT